MIETRKRIGAVWRASLLRRSALLVAVLASCTSATAPVDALSLEQPAPPPGATALRVARTHFYGQPVVMEVPAAATAGTGFTVAVTTYGGGCIAEDMTVVLVAGAAADVVPMQRVYQPRASEACTDELRITRRQASVMFASPGQAVVRVHGRAMPGDSLVVVERVVVVR
jgi:hypothetical protein